MKYVIAGCALAGLVFALYIYGNGDAAKATAPAPSSTKIIMMPDGGGVEVSAD